MGLLIYDALVIDKAVEGLEKKERCLALGVPTLNFRAQDYWAERRARGDFFSSTIETDFNSARDFFHNLGFKTVDALDISDYEGANIIDDLNSSTLSDRVAGDYDLIYDSGTLEHIFDAPTALRSLVLLLRVGGVIIHSTPANGFMDHGLWQVSPDLYRQFYRTAGYDILSSSLFNFSDPPYAIEAIENFYRNYGRKHIVRVAPEAIVVFAAQKREAVSSVDLNMQEFYAIMHGGERKVEPARFFFPFGSPPSFNDSREIRYPRTYHLQSSLDAIRDWISQIFRKIMNW